MASKKPAAGDATQRTGGVINESTGAYPGPPDADGVDAYEHRNGTNWRN